MIRIQICILIVFLIAACKKHEEENSCDDDNCYGKHDLFLSTAGKNLVIQKDTIYSFISSANDTMKLKFRKTYMEIYKQAFTCYCAEKNTDIKGEYLHGIYIFMNKDLAVKYSSAICYPTRTAFDIELSDTNKIINNINSSNTVHYLFRIRSILEKQNNLDSLSINGSYYYNIINTYDETHTDAIISDCIYSRNFGLVSYKYNSLIYTIIH